MTQTFLILQHLHEVGPLTVAESLTILGVYALSQRIGELLKEGQPIKSEWLSLPSGKHVKRYSYDFEAERVAFP